MRYDRELVGPNEVSKEVATTISGAVEKFSLGRGAKYFAWYHEQPLWYVVETERRGSYHRTLQIGIVRAQGKQIVEIAPDWEEIEKGKLVTPEIIEQDYLQVLPVEGLDQEKMLKMLAVAWEAAQSLIPGSHSTPRNMVEIPLSEFLRSNG